MDNVRLELHDLSTQKLDSLEIDFASTGKMQELRRSDTRIQRIVRTGDQQVEPSRSARSSLEFSAKLTRSVDYQYSHEKVPERMDFTFRLC